MNCPNCHQENASGANFCTGCGTRLAAGCPQCGAPAVPSDRFCAQCGFSLAVPNPFTLREQFAALQENLAPSVREQLLTPPEGENRLVTVLFTDMTASVEMTSELHPEDAVALVNRLLEAMVNALLKYEGRIDRFLGDGVLAVFGAPRAHESDSERAILAALEIRETARQLGLGATAGINTGEAYVGGVGSDRHQWVTVMGPVVNLASRLQGIAEPGQILVGEATYRQTRRAFAFSPLSVELKGIAERVVAYGVERALPKPEKARGIEGHGAELIGRDTELGQLQKALAEALEGRGQVVSIIGEAGIGKSRLVAELKRGITTTERTETTERRWEGKEGEVSAHPALAPPQSALPSSVPSVRSVVNDSEVLWLEGRCLELGVSAGYGVFVDVFREYFAQRPAEATSRLPWAPGPESGWGLRGERLVACLAELVERGALTEEQFDTMGPMLANLLSIRSGTEWEEKLRRAPPEQIKHQTFAAVRDFFVALAQQHPVVLVLDDLHWGDSLSFELIGSMMEAIPSVPLLLVCLYRPERDRPSAQLETLAAQRCPDRYTEIVLCELTPGESDRLVASLLATDSVPAAVWDVIREKTHGNPFFVEEMVAEMIASGLLYWEAEGWRAREAIDALAVPQTVQSVILSRVDRLEPELKAVLECASVMGRVFRPRLLEAVAPAGSGVRQALATLEEQGLLQPERIGPEDACAFRHVLTQETVYETLLRRRRGVLHRQVAEALGAHVSASSDEFCEEIAHHYSLSDRAAKAVDYLLQAGQKAQGMYANQEAIRWFERALGCLENLPDAAKDARAEMRAREGLGDVLFRTGAHRDAEAQFQQALDLAPASEEARTLARRVAKLADAIHWQRQWDRAIDIAESALAALGNDLFTPEAVNLLEVIMRSYWAQEDFESARRHSDQIEKILPEVPYFDSIYMIYYGIAYVALRSGDFEAALDWLRSMERVCIEHHNENGLARCYHGLGDLCQYRGEYERASSWLEKSLSYCERTGDAHLLVEGYLERAYLLILVGGNPDEIEAHIQRGMRIAEEMAQARGVSSVPRLCSGLGQAYAARGDTQNAMRYLRRAIELGAPSPPARALCLLEQLCAQQNRHEEFFDFCVRVQQQASPSDLGLRYWHLTPGFPRVDDFRPAWRDAFESPVLREGWRWEDPGGQSSCEVIHEQRVLELRTPQGHSLSGAEPTAPRLLRPASGDFAAQTVLVGAPDQECHAAGLLLWACPRDYLAFGKADAAVYEVSLDLCRQGRRATIGRGWLPATRLHLRLERHGAQVSAFCSSDGAQWQSCGETRLARDDPLWIGLYTACPGTLSASVARFEEFRLFDLEGE